MLKKLPIFSLSLLLALGLSGCDDSDSDLDNHNNDKHSQLDQELQQLISSHHLTGDPLIGRDIPDINSPKAQLGMRLFFSKSLGGDRDAACVTCHHPTLGGGDNLSLPVGVGAVDPNLLGLGREHSSTAAHFDGGPTVPRNAPTTFNIAAWDQLLFHDGRLESLGKTPQANGGDGQGIRTPDSTFGTADPLAGNNLAMGQARFPVTSTEEMKGFNHEDKDNQGIREHLASRLGNYGAGAGELIDPSYWLTRFQQALGEPNGSAENLITEQNIAMMIGEYERSQAFAETPWKHYVQGDQDAISDDAKKGAKLFFSSYENGGADCASCHSGDFFTDELFHNIAMPQMGRGKGDGDDGSEDFGRFRETKNDFEKFAFRTPTLLNVEVTGPWSHAGAYTSLEAVVKHHLNPAHAVANYDFSQLSQSNIQNLDKMARNTQAALDRLSADRAAGLNVIKDIDLGDTEVYYLVEFLKTLTDPCVKDRDCLAAWIPPAGEDPNGDQLEPVDASGQSL
ncbi:MAG: cytochrome-c peroxidase [bacterium]